MGIINDRKELKRLVESYGKRDVMNYVQHLNENEVKDDECFTVEEMRYILEPLKLLYIKSEYENILSKFDKNEELIDFANDDTYPRRTINHSSSFFIDDTLGQIWPNDYGTTLTDRAEEDDEFCEEQIDEIRFRFEKMQKKRLGYTIEDEDED